jgi:hypothetical protein
MTKQGIQRYIQEMIGSVEGMISLTIISVESGEVLAYESKDSNIDNQLAASFQIEVLRQISRGLKYVDNLNDKSINDIVITTPEQLHFIFSSENRDMVAHLIADSKQTSEGMVKLIHKKYKKDLTL